MKCVIAMTIATALTLCASNSEARAWGPISDEDRYCLIQNVYFESAKEPFMGKVAVVMTTLNRALSPHYPNNICKVVKQKVRRISKKSGKRYYVCQFSWYCLLKNHTLGDNKWRDESERAVDFVLSKFHFMNGHIYKGATHYHAVYIKTPRWAFDLKRLARVGLHIFYRPHDGKDGDAEAAGAHKIL